MKTIVQSDTTSLEIFAAIVCILFGIASLTMQLPPNMYEFQLSHLWFMEISSLGIIHLYSIFRKLNPLRTIAIFFHSMFWFYFSCSIINQSTFLVFFTCTLFVVLSAAFIQRSFDWKLKV